MASMLYLAYGVVKCNIAFSFKLKAGDWFFTKPDEEVNLAFAEARE
jgi:hypothetical protein